MLRGSSISFTSFATADIVSYGVRELAESLPVSSLTSQRVQLPSSQPSILLRLRSRRCLLLFGNLFVVNALELERLFGVELLGRGGAQSIPRTAHCMFDLGNLRFLNCIYPRVLSFLRRGSAVPSRYLLSQTRHYAVDIHVQMVCHFLRQLVRGFGEYCRSPWENFKLSVSMDWVSNFTMVYFNNLLDLLGRRQSSGRSERSLLSVLMTSSSSSPLSFLTSSMSFQTTATLSQCELICHHFRQHGCSTRDCMGPWVPSLAVFPHVHLFRVLLLTSRMTASLVPFLRRRLRSGSCFVFLAHVADFFSCTSLLSQCSVSTRSLASSRLTATFWSSSSPSRHFRAASCATSRLVCSSSSILW